MNRIDNIRAYGARKRTEGAEPARMVLLRSMQLMEDVRLLRKRIVELIDTANACIEAGIEINMCFRHHLSQYHDRYDRGTFVTNGLSHRVGFVAHAYPIRMPISEIGINMGGICGAKHFRTDGIRVYSVDESNEKATSAPVTEHMERFLDEFDVFEKAFYDYVDAILAKG